MARPNDEERRKLERRRTEKEALRAANSDRDRQVHQRVQRIVDDALARSSQAGEAIPDIPVLLRELEEARLAALSVFPPQSSSAVGATMRTEDGLAKAVDTVHALLAH